jgi:hypothetical protein
MSSIEILRQDLNHLLSLRKRNKGNDSLIAVLNRQIELTIRTIHALEGLQ